MPVCKQCGNIYKYKVYIYGVLKQLRHRTRCLDCRPFDSRDRTIGNTICSVCNKLYVYKHGQSTKTKCSNCRQNKRYQLKDKCIAYKGGRCAICSYSKCTRALSFHHVDSSSKKFNISGAHCHSWDKIKEELDKCVLLCANCHMEVEAGITKWT